MPGSVAYSTSVDGASVHVSIIDDRLDLSNLHHAKGTIWRFASERIHWREQVRLHEFMVKICEGCSQLEDLCAQLVHRVASIIEGRHLNLWVNSVGATTLTSEQWPGTASTGPF